MFSQCLLLQVEKNEYAVRVVNLTSHSNLHFIAIFKELFFPEQFGKIVLSSKCNLLQRDGKVT